MFFFQAEDGIRDRSPSRGLGDVYKRQILLRKHAKSKQIRQTLLMFIRQKLTIPVELSGYFSRAGIF